MWKFTSFFPLYLIAIFVLGQTSLADYDCSNIEKNGIKFDLKALDKTKELNSTKRETRPTYTQFRYFINPCAPLPDQEGLCKDNTYICQHTMNYKDEDDDKPRTIYIKPIAGGDKVELKPEITLNGDTDGSLSIILNGAVYDNQTQRAHITFICGKDGEDEKITNEYKDNTLTLVWTTQAACGTSEDKGMSGFTKFVIILLLIGLCYFGLGAAYNYHVYKAHGWDLLPHLDFWRDIPYLISDVFRYLVNSVRTGSRTGYSRV